MCGRGDTILWLLLKISHNLPTEVIDLGISGSAWIIQHIRLPEVRCSMSGRTLPCGRRQRHALNHTLREKVEHKSRFDLTRRVPCLTLASELWGVLWVFWWKLTVSHQHHSVSNHRQLDCLFKINNQGNIKASHSWPFASRIHPRPLNLPTKGQWYWNRWINSFPSANLAISNHPHITD